VTSGVACPYCGSTAVHAGNRGWNWKTGLLGSGNVRLTCMQCGRSFKPGKGGAARAPGAKGREWELRSVVGECASCGLQIVEGWVTCPDPDCLSDLTLPNSIIGGVVSSASDKAKPEQRPASLADDLSKLADLHRDGLLSDEEFSKAKRKLLGK
jgi:hypothetical protein